MCAVWAGEKLEMRVSHANCVRLGSPGACCLLHCSPVLNLCVTNPNLTGESRNSTLLSKYHPMILLMLASHCRNTPPMDRGPLSLPQAKTDDRPDKSAIARDSWAQLWTSRHLLIVCGLAMDKDLSCAFKLSCKTQHIKSLRVFAHFYMWKKTVEKALKVIQCTSILIPVA